MFPEELCSFVAQVGLTQTSAWRKGLVQYAFRTQICNETVPLAHVLLYGACSCASVFKLGLEVGLAKYILENIKKIVIFYI